MLSKDAKFLTSSGNERQDQLQRATSPGMIDWVDLAGEHHCRSCAHFHKAHCQLFVKLMRARLNSSTFLGPKLPPGQRACRRYEKAHQQGRDNMTNMLDRYPRKGATFLKASDLGNTDLVVQIERIEFDQNIGSSKTGDLVHFNGEDFCLVLNGTTVRQIAALHGGESNLWSGKWLALFNDITVEYEGHRGGVRVRPYVPTPGNGKPITLQQPQNTDDPPF